MGAFRRGAFTTLSPPPPPPARPPSPTCVPALHMATGVCSSAAGIARSSVQYWGAVTSATGEVAFALCPDGHCCQRAPCPSINSCNGNRVGQLCSQCPEGFVEGVGTTECVRVEECNMDRCGVGHTLWQHPHTPSLPPPLLYSTGPPNLL